MNSGLFMGYKKSVMNEGQFIDLLEKELNKDLSNHHYISQALASLSSNHLLPRNKNYPSIYYFWYIAGVNYVLVTDHINASQSLVYELQESGSYSPFQATEHTLRDVAQAWSGDLYSIMSEVYGLSVEREVIRGFDKNACVWFERGGDCDEGDSLRNDYVKDELGQVVVYATAADAQAYVDTLEDTWIDCKNGIVKAYYYSVVPAPTAAVLVPSSPLPLNA